MNQQPKSEPIDIQHDEDYLYEQYLAQEKMNEEYWQWKTQDTIDRINAYYEPRFCTADVESTLMEVTNDEQLVGAVLHKLDEIYLRRQVYELQQIQMVDTQKETQTSAGDGTTIRQN